MLGQPWWYWALFALAAVIVVTGAFVARWEQRQNERDHEAWKRFNQIGGRR